MGIVKAIFVKSPGGATSPILADIQNCKKSATVERKVILCEHFLESIPVADILAVYTLTSNDNGVDFFCDEKESSEVMKCNKI